MIAAISEGDSSENGTAQVKIPKMNVGRVVWTSASRRMYATVGRALRAQDPVLLVGATGCGKTSMVQLFSQLLGRELRIVSCHMHTDASDLLGGLRPVPSLLNGLVALRQLYVETLRDSMRAFGEAAQVLPSLTDTVLAASECDKDGERDTSRTNGHADSNDAAVDTGGRAERASVADEVDPTPVEVHVGLRELGARVLELWRTVSVSNEDTLPPPRLSSANLLLSLVRKVRSFAVDVTPYVQSMSQMVSTLSGKESESTGSLHQTQQALSTLSRCIVSIKEGWNRMRASSDG